MLTKKQFDIMTLVKQEGMQPVQRVLAQKLGMSLGTVNKTMAELDERGFLKNGYITDKGMEALEPYQVQRAVILAAGFGSRLVPITLNTPKPLVRVKGKRIIDGLLDAFLSAGINEIYLVRGYLGEQFDQLLYKYPMIHFIDNPSYNESNNISSAMCVREHMKNAYVCDADLLLKNPHLITQYQYQANYLGVPVEKTDDWCLKTNGRFVTQVSIGGTNCYHMFGISYWNNDDGERLFKDIETV